MSKIYSPEEVQDTGIFILRLAIEKVNWFMRRIF